MIVLSNMFRGNHPQQHLGTRDANPTAERSAKERISSLLSQSSLRTELRTRTRSSFNEKRATGEASNSGVKEKRLSSSVDEIITKRDVNSKVICSAKGLLETNLDDLFNDVQRPDGWAEPKSLGASVPTLSSCDDRGATEYRGSLVSGDDTADDTATDSDSLDDVAREQRKCMGARRFGHMLRRVISRNGKPLTLYLFRPSAVTTLTYVLSIRIEHFFICPGK
ncbi:unnamed protein product, partial [Iphiclides podalirius]